MSKKKPTIVDIANKLGISPSAVSKAFSDHPKMSSETKRKVAQAAKELGYTRNNIASGLRKGKSGLIGVMVPWVNLNFFSTAIKGIEDVLGGTGYNILIGQSKDEWERERNQVKAFLNAQVEGIIASISATTEDCSHFEEAINSGVKVILFDREVSKLEVEQVLIDDYGGAYEATEHLISKGYTRIGIISGPEKLLSYAKRKKGYRDALKAAGLPVDESIIMNAPTQTIHGQLLAAEMLKMEQPPDAIFCLSDLFALGALKAIKDKKLRVPEDVGLMGFSNEDFTTFVTPSISSVDQFSEKMGSISARLLLSQLELSSGGETIDRFVAQKHVLSPRLLTRESTLR